uniref:ATP-binding protein n=1 Tax=Mycolicibacterium poriferae TaxID=39694 RepID=UPI00321C0C3A
GVLLDNALLPGAGDVSISAREVGENAIAIDVGDQGPGVPSSALTNRGVGRGMGLPLARRLAESEGGRLTVGTTSSPVTLLLPSRSRAGSAEGSNDPGSTAKTTG